MSKKKSEKKEYEFICDFCNKVFISKEECKKHEKECVNKNLTGIGGWLIPWVIYSSIITLFLLISLFSGAGLFYFLGVGSYCWFMFCLIKRKKSFNKAVNYFINSLIAIGIIRFFPIFIEAIKGNYEEGVLLLDYIAHMTGQLIALGINIVWFFYFKKSKRVKNTFTK